MKLIITDY